MANYNLTSQQIKDSFRQLGQVSGSFRPSTAGMISGSTIYDGTGSLVENLYVKAETSVSASHSLIADNATSATTALTASFFGEGLITASAVASTITFTKDNGTTFDIVVAQSGSTVSSSYASFASNAHSASYAVSASSAIYTVSSSYAIKATSADTATSATSATTATSASHALQSDNATSASSALYSVSASAAIRAVSSSHAVASDTSITASYALNAVGVISASYAISSSHSEFADLAHLANSSTTSISASHALESNAALTATSASSALYSVSASSAITARIANSVSTLTQDLVVTGAISASAISSSGNITGNVVGSLTGNVTAISGLSSFDNITVSGTGSFGYLQSVTGSSIDIGTNIIILNNDTPAQRFAGIKVLDSGSNVTGSFLWDGLSDDWKYSFSSSATHEAAVVMMGPEMADIETSVYPNLNTIVKGTGTHHLNDSKITDDGTTVGISTKLKVTGSIEAVTSITGSNLSILNTGSFGNVNVDGALKASGSYNQLIQNSANQGGLPIEVRTLQYGNNTTVRGETYDVNYIGMNKYADTIGTYDYALSMWKGDAGFVNWSTAFSSGRAAGVEVKTISGSFGKINVNTRANTGEADVQINASQIDIVPSQGISLGSQWDASPLTTVWIGGYNVSNFQMRMNETSSMNIQGGMDIQYTLNVNSGSTFGDATVNGLLATQIVSSSNIHANEVYVTGSLVSEGTATLAGLTVSGATLRGNTLISGSLITTGSVSTEVISGSLSVGNNFALDMSLGNMFTCQLVSGSNVNIQPANIKKGGTVMLKTIQPSTSAISFGSLSYESSINFTAGTAFIPTQASGSVDILTFTSFDGTTLDCATVSNLQTAINL